MTAITRANLTVRVSVPHPAGAELSWQGMDEGDERCGRGWAVLQPEGDFASGKPAPQSRVTAVRFIVRRTPGFGSSATPMTVRAGRCEPMPST